MARTLERFTALLTAGLWVGFWAFSLHADANMDLYPFPQIEEARPKKQEAAKAAADPYSLALSRKMGVPVNAVTDMAEKGLGRVEMIRLILMSQKGKKPLADLAKERGEGARFAKMAGELNLDNRAIRKETLALYKEIRKEAERIAAETAKGPATAGVSPTLAGESTGYATEGSSASRRGAGR